MQPACRALLTAQMQQPCQIAALTHPLRSYSFSKALPTGVAPSVRRPTSVLNKGGGASDLYEGGGGGLLHGHQRTTSLRRVPERSMLTKNAKQAAMQACPCSTVCVVGYRAAVMRP